MAEEQHPHRCIACNAAGNLVMFGFKEQVIVANLPDLELVHSLAGHRSMVSAVTFGDHLSETTGAASGDLNGTVIIWSAEFAGILKFNHDSSIRDVSYVLGPGLVPHLVSAARLDFGVWAPRNKSVTKSRRVVTALTCGAKHEVDCVAFGLEQTPDAKSGIRVASSENLLRFCGNISECHLLESPFGSAPSGLALLAQPDVVVLAASFTSASCIVVYTAGVDLDFMEAARVPIPSAGPLVALSDGSLISGSECAVMRVTAPWTPATTTTLTSDKRDHQRKVESIAGCSLHGLSPEGDLSALAAVSLDDDEGWQSGIRQYEVVSSLMKACARAEPGDDEP